MSNENKINKIGIISCSALFIAISIVCGKYLAISVGPVLRFSFENLPIILSGYLFGPVSALCCAVIADIIGCFLVGYAINPFVLLGGALIGVISGILPILLKKIALPIRLGITVLISHTVGSVIIKTIGLASWYSIPLLELVLWRALNYLIVGALEFLLLLALLKSRTFISQIESTLNIKYKR